MTTSTTEKTVAVQLLHQAAQRGLKALSEYESKRFLAAYGIPVVTEELVPNGPEAVEAASRLGYPVAVKACSADLLHKSDRGLVHLNLHDAAAVERAVTDILRTLADTPVDGILVQSMVSGKREIIVGGMRDETFGPSVMLGLGGVFVEALSDVVFRLAPLDERDAREMINEIRAQGIFGAFRGEPAIDREKLCGALRAVGAVMTNHREVSQVDINPMIFKGAGPVAVDALITLGPASVRGA